MPFGKKWKSLQTASPQESFPNGKILTASWFRRAAAHSATMAAADEWKWIQERKWIS
jgi:hypothetical protein